MCYVPCGHRLPQNKEEGEGGSLSDRPRVATRGLMGRASLFPPPLHYAFATISVAGKRQRRRKSPIYLGST